LNLEPVGNQPKGTIVNFAITGRNIKLTAPLLGHVERRLRAALRRFGDTVRHAVVQLTCMDGPRSGFYPQCKVTAFLSPRGKVIVKEIGADFHTAINRALDKLERSVRLKLRRITRLDNIENPAR
jgi:ribosomal subunit interface protein